MPYYCTCPYCGANLDPGERCDCPESKREHAAQLIAPLTVGEKLQLLELLKNIPASVTSTDEDGVEQIKPTVSTPMIPEKEGVCKYGRKFSASPVSYRQRGREPAPRRSAAQ